MIAQKASTVILFLAGKWRYILAVSLSIHYIVRLKTLNFGLKIWETRLVDQTGFPKLTKFMKRPNVFL